MPINWCPTCNGAGSVGWLWRKRVCPECKASTRKIHGGHLCPVPPAPTGPAPPPAPPKR